MAKPLGKIPVRNATRRHQRIAAAVEMMEPRVLMSAATYTGIATNAVNPTASTVNSGTSFLSIFGGSTVGAVNGSIAQAYGVLEFGPASTAFPAAGHHVNSLSSIGLTLFNSASTGAFGGASGSLNIWLAPDNTTALTTGTSGTLRYQTGDLPNGVGGSAPQLGIVESGSASTLLGTFNFDHTAINTPQLSSLTNYSTAIANTIVGDLNNGTTFRLVITAGDGNVAADLDGSTTVTTATKFPFDPVLSFGVDETITAQALTFSAPTYSVNEAAGTESITVNRAPASNGDLTGTETVQYATSDGVNTVTPTAISESTNTVTVTAANTFAVGQQVTMAGVTPTGYNGPYTILSATATNFTYSDPTSGLATVTSGHFGTASVVSAANGTNYTSASGTLTFAPGVTSQTITVPITNLHPQGGNKFFNVTLSNPVLTGDPGINALIGNPATVPVTILDNQETFSLGSSAFTVNESAGTAEFSVTRTGFLTDPATVAFSTTDGTAKSGTNYTGTTTGVVNFAAGAAVGVFSVPILPANPQGGNLNFTVTLTSAAQSGAQAGDFGVLGAQTTATETIVDSTPLTNNLTGSAASVSDIETSGPFLQAFAPVVGDVNAGTSSFSFLSYEVLEFSQASSPGLYPTLGTTVNASGIANLSLQMFNTDASGSDNFSGHVGNFNVYFIPDTDATTATSALSFSTAAAALPSGLPAGVKPASGAVFTAAPVLLGTFSFRNSAGYDTYTPAAIPASVENALVADLNGGSNFRLAVTPGTNGNGAVAADWRGVFSGQTPTLSFSAAQTVNNLPEFIAFNSPTYTVNETGGTATITLSRTGPTTDTATVNYLTSDGSALAGTNYALTTGTATFSAGNSTTTFPVPIINAANQGGDKALKLTLSTPATAGPGTIGGLGSQTTASLTIRDSSTAPIETLTPSLSYASDIESGGPFDDTEFKAEGTSSITRFASYGAADFNDPAIGAVTPAATITAINNITLSVTNGTNNAAGPIDIYLVPDSTSNITVGSGSPHFYDTTQGIEGVGTQFGTPLLLGVVNYTDITANDVLTLSLNNYSHFAEATLISALNGHSKFRIVATPESTGVSADWVAAATSISINVQEGTPGVPTAGAVVAAPNPVTTGNSTTLTASGFSDSGGTIAGVTFYRETNGTAGLQTNADTLVGIGSPSGNTFTITTSTLGLADGSYTYYAVALDSTGVSSPVASTSVSVVGVSLLAWNLHGQGGGTGTNTFGVSPLASATTDASVTNSLNLTRGSGIGTSGTGAANAWGGTSFFTGTTGSPVFSTTGATAVAANQFVTFGLTVQGGSVDSLGNLEMNYRRSGTGPLNGMFQYQLNGGTFVTIEDDANEFANSTGNAGVAITPINLSGIAALQNLPAGTAVVFRVVPYGATGTGGTWYINDGTNNLATDLVVNGTVSAAATAPTLVSSAVANGATQRSTFDSVSVVFSQAVSFTAASFTFSYETVADNVAVQNSGGTSSPTYTALSNTADINFSTPDGGFTWIFSPKLSGAVDRTGGAGDVNGLGIFADGVYQLTLHGSAISAGGLPLNGGSDSVPQFADGTGTLHNGFSSLFGDIGGAAIVNANDSKAFGKALTTTLGTTGYNAAFDYSGTNSVINANDNKKFGKNFGISLLMP